ncbi:MAG: hypothetical protein MK212_10545 [Saprospiraceae bacterium]|nr:hypothetical protein [Saprospiraceae bacterium]
MFCISFLDAIQNDLTFYILNILAFAVIILVTWWYTRIQQFKTIAQLRTEIATLQIQQNNELFELEDIYKAKEERMRLIIKDLRDQINKGDLSMVRARRNELSNILALDYAKAMSNYTRLADQFYDGNRYRHTQFIENHILPFLQNAGDIMKVLNQPSVRDTSDAADIKLNYMNFDFAFDFIKKDIRFTSFGLKSAMKKHAQRLGFGNDI